MYRLLRTILLTTILPVSAWSVTFAEEQAPAEIERLTLAISRTPDIPRLYLERGDVFYEINNLNNAAADYTKALSLDDSLDKAYFGRGMTYGRMGLIDEGIADLSIYIQRHPDSSVAYTKRGVRNIWRGNYQEAERDLERAVALDPNNAEAHDDLGVVHAKNKQLNIAAKHFSTAIRLDPSYQKAYHNLALCYFMAGQAQNALQIVDAGLALNADNRNSLLLKSTILEALDRKAEAREIADHAEFLPDSNWTERSEIAGEK